MSRRTIAQFVTVRLLFFRLLTVLQALMIAIPCVDLWKDTGWYDYYENTGSGTFNNYVRLDGKLGDLSQGANVWANMQFADIDNDGATDMVQGTWSNQDIQVYWGEHSLLAAGGAVPSWWGDLTQPYASTYSEYNMAAIAMDCSYSYKDFKGVFIAFMKQSGFFRD